MKVRGVSNFQKYRGTLKPLTPDPYNGLSGVDRVVAILEHDTATAAPTLEEKLQLLGWTDSFGGEMSWSDWQARAPNYNEWRQRGA
jgi:hypothetical protein